MIKGNSNGNGNVFRVWPLLFALALFPLISQAQTLTVNSATGHYFTSNGGTYGVGVITNNPPANSTWTLPAGTATGQAVGNFGVGANAAGTAPQVHTRGSFPIPGGNGRAVDVDVKSPVDKRAAAKAIVGLGKSFLGPLNVGIALWDLAAALNVKTEDTDPATRGVAFYEEIPSCTLPGCFWQAGAYKAGSPMNALTAYRDALHPTCAHLEISGQTATYASGGIWTSAAARAGGYGFCAGPGINKTGTEVMMKDYLSEQELEDKIANQAGWPTAASRALADAIKSSATDPNSTPIGVTPGAPAVSGPAQVTGPTTTSEAPIKDPATGAQIGTATTVNNTTHNITYQGSNINITNQTTSTTTNTYNNGSPTTVTTTTTGGEPAKADPPEDPCVKAPDRVGCKLLGTPDSATIPTSTENLTYTPESTGFGDGSCPPPVTWSSTRAGSHSISYQPACDFATTYMRPVALLIGALMALFILMPGRPET